MNGAGPCAPEPGDSRGVTTGGTTGSRALGSDIERHEVHGATQEVGTKVFYGKNLFCRAFRETHRTGGNYANYDANSI